MTINERIRYLRKDILKMTQQDFADTLNISRSNEGNIEIGRIAVTERVLVSICEKLNVNEEWLKSGKGEPLIPKTRNQTITDFLGDLINEEDGSFKKRLIEALAELDESDWETLKKIAINVTKKEG